jgi:hypothetical protein
MNMRKIGLLVALLLWSWGEAPVLAEGTSQGEKIQDWIVDLSSDDPSVREDAKAKLMGVGQSALLPVVEARCGKGNDIASEACMEILQTWGKDSVMNWLFALLPRWVDSTDQTQYRASNALTMLWNGIGFGFVMQQSEEERQGVITRWQEWWEAHREDFQF